MSTFDPSVPTGFINLDEDYKNLQQNFQQINNTYAIDHVALTNNSGLPPTPGGINGMHTVVHLNTQTVHPAVNTSAGQFYNKVPTIPPTFDQLFYLTNSIGAQPAQISGSSGLRNGYSWMSGILVQWGFQPVTTTSSGRTLFATLNVNFPVNVFTVIATPVYDSNVSTPSNSFADVFIDQNAIPLSPNLLNNLGFSWRFCTNSLSVTGFFWVAIGN